MKSVMASSAETNSALRARIGFLERKLQNDAQAPQNIIASPVGQKRKRHVPSKARRMRAKHAQPAAISRSWTSATSAIGSQLSEVSSKPVGKSFKWVAPPQPAAATSSASRDTAPALSTTSTSVITASSSSTSSSSSSSSSSGIAASDRTPLTSPGRPPNVANLVAQIKSINKVAKAKYGQFNDKSLIASKSVNRSWSSAEAPSRASIKPPGKKERKRIKEAHKWANSSIIQSKTAGKDTFRAVITAIIQDDSSNQSYDSNYAGWNTSDATLDTRKKMKVLSKKNKLVEKKTWTKQDDDFTLVPISTNKYCLFFNKLGNCRMGSKCVFEHDVSRVAVCRPFLQGRCVDPHCSLSHSTDPEKMPDCDHFEKGSCFKDNCPYRHVKFNDGTGHCDDFLTGYCVRGNNCKYRHTVKVSQNTLKVSKVHKNTGKVEDKTRKETTKKSVVEMNVPLSLGEESYSGIRNTDLVETDTFIPFSSLLGGADAIGGSYLRGGDRRLKTAEVGKVGEDAGDGDEGDRIGEGDEGGEEEEESDESDDNDGEEVDEEEEEEEEKIISMVVDGEEGEEEEEEEEDEEEEDEEEEDEHQDKEIEITEGRDDEEGNGEEGGELEDGEEEEEEGEEGDISDKGEEEEEVEEEEGELGLDDDITANEERKEKTAIINEGRRELIEELRAAKIIQYIPRCLY